MRDLPYHQEHVSGSARPDHADGVLFSGFRRADQVLALIFHDEDAPVAQLGDEIRVSVPLSEGMLCGVVRAFLASGVIFSRRGHPETSGLSFLLRLHRLTAGRRAHCVRSSRSFHDSVWFFKGALVHGVHSAERGERVPSAQFWEAITKVVGCVPFRKAIPICRCPGAFRWQRGRLWHQVEPVRSRYLVFLVLRSGGRERS